MIDIYSSSAPNYLAKVRALFESVREHCPEARLHWLVADEPHDDLRINLDDEPFDSLIFATDLEIGRDRRWLFQHSIVELSTAVKPAAGLRILEQPDCDAVLYLDPDIVLFSPLDDLLEELLNKTMVLTPHQLQPEKDSRAVFHEIDSLRYGVFNLGFVGVRKCPEGIRFFKWWRDRCQLNCEANWESGVFTDQKWVNFAPIFFDDVSILRNPRFNVAPWNISQRALSGTFDEGFKVDGHPLGFYHFTGLDSGAHLVHVANLEGHHTTAKMLVDWYLARTDALEPAEPHPWHLGCFSDGLPILDIHRLAYRRRLDLHKVFPNPYLVTDGTLDYRQWFDLNARIELPELFKDSLDDDDS